MVSLCGLAVIAAVGAAAVAAAAAAESCASPPLLGHTAGRCLVADGGEEGSLLQAHRLSAARPLRAGAGCPPPWQWAIWEEAARSTLLGQALQGQLPFWSNSSFDREPIGVGACRASLTGHAEISLDARVAGARGIRLARFTCDRALCTNPIRLGCGEYKPLETTVGLAADSIHVHALANVAVSWGEGCIGGAGSLELRDADVGFTVVGTTLTGRGSMDVTVLPFNVSSFALSSLTLAYASITDIRCIVNHEPVAVCLDAMSMLKTEEYKHLLQDMINSLLGSLNGALSGVSLGLPRSHEQHGSHGSSPQITLK